MTERLLIEDGRDGFVMVPCAVIAACRSRLTGATLAQSLGATVVLAAAALRDGHANDGRQICDRTIRQLCQPDHFGTSKELGQRILTHLQEAAAITCDTTRRDGALRLPSRIELLGDPVPFARVDIPALAAIGRNANGPARLRAFAMYLTLVDLAGAQRHGGDRQTVQTTYSELAKLTGVSVRSGKDLITLLVASGVIERHAQTSDNGMAHANRYRLIQVSAATTPAAPTVIDPGVHQVGQGRAADTLVGVQQTGHEGAQARTRQGESQDMTVQRPGQGGASSTAYAHAREEQTQQTIQNIPTDQLGERLITDPVEILIERFMGHLASGLSAARVTRLYAPQRNSWLPVAAELLEDFPLDQLLAGVEYLQTDTILSSKAKTFPAFAELVDDILLRARAAATGAAARRPAADMGGGEAAPSWATAWNHLRRAVSAHGRSGETKARASLAQASPVLEEFVDHLGWSSIATASGETDLKFAYLDFCKTAGRKAA